jgi:hypothetical protein
MVHGAARTLFGSSFTKQQARELISFGMNTSHAAFLGYRVHVMARDALQLFFALPRGGADLARVITKYTTDPAYRKLVWDESLRGGAIQLTMPHRVSPGALGGELEQASVGMAPENMSKRMRLIGAVGAEVRDWVPDVLKGSSDSVLKPLYLYGKQQELMRALVYRAGFEKAERALINFRNAGANADLNTLMGESSARTFDPAWQEEFKRLVAIGDDRKASAFLGRQLADATQFSYGATENPAVSRSMTGKLFMQFGSFQTQYVQYLRESLANGNVADKAKFLMVAGTVSAALEAAQRETGWHFRYMNPYAIGFAGGPAISMGMGMLQGAGAIGNAIFDPERQGIDRALAGGASAVGQMANAMNPVSGLYATASGLGSAINDSPDPTRAIGRLMLTGERGALPDILQTIEPGDVQPVSNPVRQGQYQMPAIPQMQPIYPAGVPTTPPSNDSLIMLGATDPGRARYQGDHLVYDSERLDPNGRSGTHDMTYSRRLLQPGETWEQYEQRILDAPAGALKTGRPVRDISELDSETANRVQALQAYAAQQGVQLDVGETVRSQGRQEALFAQGRNPNYPGPIVTWTLTSSHAQGRAIDFIVNGDRSGRDPGYTWLQQAAKQFGLVPLGPQDPGHLAATDSSIQATPDYSNNSKPHGGMF